MSGATQAASIDGARLLADIETLAAIGAREGGGLMRRAYSPAWRAACDWLMAAMHEAGMRARRDAAGNVIGRLGPDDGPAVATGSHLDTVPDGGPLDGTYGVLAGLACARVLSAARPARAVEVIAFADEEGAYASLLGSRAVTGTLAQDEIARARDTDGVTLADALAASGLDAARLGDARRPAGDFRAYVELHIEQGPVLERAGLPIGIVEGIVGVREIDYLFSGRADHAGTTPMGMRHDALRAACAFVSEAGTALELLYTPSTRQTFGSLRVLPGAANVVPAEVLLRQELRDLDEQRVATLAERSRAIARVQAQRHGVTLEVIERSWDPPAAMSPAVMAHIATACAALDLPALQMPSGAGHDAQALAGVCESGMIFVPSRGGASHRPDEWTEAQALLHGAEVLLGTLRALLESAEHPDHKAAATSSG